MSMQNESIISKGKYRLPQMEGMVSVKQYFFVRNEDGKKTLLLRFFNDRNEICTGFTFTLYCLDARGNLLETQNFETDGLRLGGKTMFVFEDAIKVSEKCVNFKLVVKTASYGNYTYTNDNDKLSLDYEEKQGKKVNSKAYANSTTSRKISTNNFKLPWLYVIASFVVLAIAVVIIGIQISDFKNTQNSFSLSGIQYEFVSGDAERGSVLITGYSSYYRDMVIPNQIEGYPVVGIKDGAFKNNTTIRNVYIDGINVGAQTFYGCSLETVTISNITEIGTEAFYGCENLKSVSISHTSDDEILEIGDRAFGSCKSLETVTINQFASYRSESYILQNDYNVKTLNLKNFAYNFKDYTSAKQEKQISSLFYTITNSALETLTIENIDTIPDGFCKSLRNLKTVTIKSNKLTYIGEEAFSGCISLETLSLKSIATHVGENAFRNTLIDYFDCSRLTAIEPGTFYGCERLSDVNLRNNKVLEKIETKAFVNCYSLKSVDYPETVTFIGSNAFEKSGLESFAIKNEEVYIGENILENCKNVKSLDLMYLPENYVGYLFGLENDPTTITIPSPVEKIILRANIEEIPYGAFAGCTSLTLLDLPSKIKSIGEFSFYNCSSLSDINLPNVVETIGAYAFAKSGLSTVALPDSITEISAGVFSDCENLSAIKMSRNIKVIRDKAFAGCSSLTQIHLYEVETIGAEAFMKSGLTSLEVPATAYVESGILAGCEDVEEIIIPLNNITISSYFYSSDINSYVSKSLKKVTVNSGERICSYAFDECNSIEEIVFEEGVTYVDSYAIYYCENLRRLVLPNTLSNLQYDSIYECCRLYEICNESPNVEIDLSSYNGRYSLEITSSLAPVCVVDGYTFAKYSGNWYLINWDKDITSIEPNATFTYENGEEVENVTGWYIPHNLFKRNDTIKSVKLPSTLQGIGVAAFDTVRSLSDVYFDAPEAPIAIDERCFSNCASLKNVSLSGNIVEIGYRAFDSCNSLTTIALPNTVIRVDAYAFSNCTSLESVTVGVGVLEISDYAFLGCEILYDVYNLSALPIEAGSKLYGNIARNAVVVHRNVDEELSKEVTIKNVGVFRNYGDQWLMIEYYDTLKTLDTTILEYNRQRLASLRFIANVANESDMLESLYLGSNVTQVQEGAFANCVNLRGVYCEDSAMKEIEEYTFANCSGIIELTLPSGIRKIGQYAFEYCYKLLSITIPSTITSIDYNAFLGCTELFEVYDLSPSITVSKNTENGYVGYYSKAIYTSKSSGQLERYETKGLYFVKYGNVWYLHHYSGNESNLLVIPKVGEQCVILNQALSGCTAKNFVFPNNIISIQGSLGVEYGQLNIYYEGSESQWYSITGRNNVNGNIKFYDVCVHNDYTWTYVRGTVSTTYCELRWTETAATCVSQGQRVGVCNCSIGCDYSTTTILPMIEHKFVENVCTYCNLQMVNLNSSNFETFVKSGVISVNNFKINDQNQIVSTNEDHGTTAELIFTANKKMTIKVKYGTVSEDYSDVLYVYKNDTCIDVIYGRGSYTEEIVLEQNDTLRFVFEKYDSYVTTNEYAYIMNVAFEIQN